MTLEVDTSQVKVAAVERSRVSLRSTLASRVEVIVGGVLVLVAVLIAIIIPMIDPAASTAVGAAPSLVPPGLLNLLGTDQLGRDQLARVAVGYGISLTIAVGAVLLSVVVGGLLGLLAATATSAIDGLIMRILDVVMAFPALLLAIVVVALFGAGTEVLMLAIGITFVPIVARVTRAAALETTRQPYIEAAMARGARRGRVIFRHIAPNSLGPVVVQASILIAIAIMLEASLSFVGLGVQPPTPSLGLMLSTGRDFMVSDPWIVAVPAIAILEIVLGFTLIGDGLQTWLDPKKRAIAR
ncbi:ABC transporter permease [Cryobacterium sp. Hb1]|uniref:ABC transporter permease n=1 Tax=Cryobacterium sp. Hb1 TaxID=1259147 RepID=UPI00106AC43A|nr:ABC transporter permease [Cryobacterium sp. Hb1]TFD70469.1 ABC transporter permease [Cryobacterium sp. Hb1]